jgi:hypothetical protein
MAYAKDKEFVTIALPPGGRDTLKRRATAKRISMNDYAVSLLLNGKCPKKKI